MKLLIGEIKGGKSRKGNLSSRHKRSSSKESRLSNEDSRRTNDFVENSLDESTTNKTTEEPSKAEEQEQEKASSTQHPTQEEKDIEKAIEPMKSATYEVLAVDSNTERKFLENITFNQPDHLSDVELKSTVFNSYKTIETLQQDLM